MVKAVCIAVACALLGGCGTTHIYSEPPRALVYVNGALIGKTPVTYHHDRGLARRYHIEVYRDGYEPLDLYVDTQMSYVWGLFGAFLLFPKLWAWSLPSELQFNLRPTEGYEGDDWEAEWEREDREQRGDDYYEEDHYDRR